jgi:Collagen triple helix repeat (20 copies)
MANNKIQIRRTSVPGRVPTISQLSIGELGINLSDKKIYTANSTHVFELGSNNTDLNVANVATINAISANGSLGLPNQGLVSNGSSIYWADNPGYTGSRGNTGYVGSFGDTGYTGSFGYTGYVGSRGADGYTGSFGYTGYVGSQGLTGYVGSRGTDGIIGVDGYSGSRGYTGSKGTDGTIGYNGSAGYTGSKGTDGNVGYTGSIGVTTSYVFDGGGPTADYSLGPAFDCGGVY